MLECESCLKQADYTQAVVGDNWFPTRFPLCSEHARQCQKLVVASDDDVDDSGQHERVCGLTCCESCISDRACDGEFDPRDEY